MPAHECASSVARELEVGFLHICQYAQCLHVVCESDAAVAMFVLLECSLLQQSWATVWLGRSTMLRRRARYPGRRASRMQCNAPLFSCAVSLAELNDNIQPGNVNKCLEC